MEAQVYYFICQNSRAQSKYIVVNLIRIWHKQTYKLEKSLDIINKVQLPFIFGLFIMLIIFKCFLEYPRSAISWRVLGDLVINIWSEMWTVLGYIYNFYYQDVLPTILMNHWKYLHILFILCLSDAYIGINNFWFSYCFSSHIFFAFFIPEGTVDFQSPPSLKRTGFVKDEWNKWSDEWSTYIITLEARVAQHSALNSWSQGCEFEPYVGLCVVSLSKALYSDLLLSTQVYNWAGKVTGSLCGGRPSHSNIIPQKKKKKWLVWPNR